MSLGPHQYILFINESFDQALVWANRIQNYPRVDVRPDILKAARLFSLMIHYELGNHDLRDYLSRSVRNYFARSPKLIAQDREFFRLFNLLLQVPSDEEKENILQQLSIALTRPPGPSLGFPVALEWTRHQLKKAPLSAAWQVIIPTATVCLTANTLAYLKLDLARSSHNPYAPSFFTLFGRISFFIFVLVQLRNRQF